MAGKRFPQDYTDDEKQALATGDKLFIWDAAAGKNGIIDAANLNVGAGSGTETKDGYSYNRNLGNNTGRYQQGETIEGVGSLYPGFYVKCYFTSSQSVGGNAKDNLVILFSKEI